MNYQTKQKELILTFFKNHVDETIFPQMILNTYGDNVSKATLYRFIKDEISKGLIKKVYDPNAKAYGYQYLKDLDCHHHLHLKCQKCGKTIHLECDDARQFVSHIESSHKFIINESLTTIYGICEDCQKKKGE